MSDSALYGCFTASVTSAHVFTSVSGPSSVSSVAGQSCQWGTIEVTLGAGSFPFPSIDSGVAHTFFFWAFGLVLGSWFVSHCAGVVVVS
ncbi:hypothetical protein, partial [Pelagicoccus mobilis]|uniref:hypothetical protein n=1 Tax=Pelagicoccus mobilis TaxID=415221 RepID=UPI0035E67A34